MREFLRRRVRGLKGMSLVETITAVLILTLSVIVMARLTSLKVSEQASLSDQYIMNIVDSYMYNIYTDFHNCEDLRIEEFTNSGMKTVMLTFVMRNHDLGSRFYSFEEQTGSCYEDGVEKFKCTSFTVSGTTQSLFVIIKLPNEKRMEMNIFR